MKTKTTVQVPATTREELKYTCDRCGAPCGYDEPDVDNTERRVRIECNESSTYAEGGLQERRVVDCCFRCFNEHVVPVLASIGFTARDDLRGS